MSPLANRESVAPTRCGTRFAGRSQSTAAPPERVSDSLTNDGGAEMPRGHYLTETVKDAIWGVRAEGLSEAEIGRRLGLPKRTVSKYLERLGGIRPRARRRPERCLALAEREEISRGIARGESARDIGRTLGRSHTTISREINRCGGRRRYRAHAAEWAAWRRARRSRPTKLELCPELRELVIERLRQDHSPQQISGWLRLSYPDNDEMQVSHETIYRALYVQARGSLRRELTRHLRTRRQKRFARAHSGHGQGPGKIAGMVMISERPPEVSDRAVPGHWEGDLLIGTRSSAIATLVERQTRYCQLVALPEGTNAEPVCEALKASITTLPAQLRRSLTWDQGKEMAEHRRFSVETGVEVYFCDPRSPWQRGSNENTNGLLRQYFPKGKSLAGVTQADLDEVARKLNDRPRQTLGFRTPAEKLTELIDGLETGAPGR
jgi:IS30 family transposase